MNVGMKLASGWTFGAVATGKVSGDRTVGVIPLTGKEYYISLKITFQIYLMRKISIF